MYNSVQVFMNVKSVHLKSQIALFDISFCLLCCLVYFDHSNLYHQTYQLLCVGIISYKSKDNGSCVDPHAIIRCSANLHLRMISVICCHMEYLL